METYSIVIPAFNEEARIGATLERVMACIESKHWAAEVLVVDDGSRDAPAAIVSRTASRYANLRLIENDANRGKGHSVRNGILQAQGDIVMFTDADLSAPMEEAELLFAAIESGAEVYWVAMARPLASDVAPADLQAILRALLQLSDATHHALAVGRHAMRVQGVSVGGGDGHLHTPADWAMGI